MREHSAPQWEWVVAHNAMAVGLIASLLWLRADFLRAIGGGVALLFLGATSEWLHRQTPYAQSWFLRFVVLGYLVMGLNLTIGLADLSGWGLSWMLVTSLLMVIAVVMCAGVAEAHLSFKPPYLGLPRHKRVVIFGLLGPVVLAILAQSLAFVEPVTARTGIGLLAVATIFVCSILTGVVAVLGLRDYRADLADRLVTRKMLLASPLWLVTGSLVEVVRDSWAVWLLSALSLLIVQVWVYLLSRRIAPLEGVKTRE